MAIIGVGALAAGRRRRRLGLTPAQALVTVALAPLCLARAIGPGKLRYAAVWVSQMLAYEVAFEAPIDRRAALRNRLRIDYPIRADSVLGRGIPPGARLQALLRDPPRLTPLDVALVVIYALWELEPHLAMLWLLHRHPSTFRRAAGRLAATFDLTLVGYWLVPTAPPWWASEKLGRMNGEVRRVVLETQRELRGQPRPVDQHEVGANPWAAMPSDHFASALMTALVLRETDPAVGTAAFLYAALLGFALIYLGEHYVVDLLAGGALAALVYGLEPAVRETWNRLL